MSLRFFARNRSQLFISYKKIPHVLPHFHKMQLLCRPCRPPRSLFFHRFCAFCIFGPLLIMGISLTPGGAVSERCLLPAPKTSPAAKWESETEPQTLRQVLRKQGSDRFLCQFAVLNTRQVQVFSSAHTSGLFVNTAVGVWMQALFLPLPGRCHSGRACRAAPLARGMRCIPKNYLFFPLDFNFIYVIFNIIKVKRKGELIWR